MLAGALASLVVGEFASMMVYIVHLLTADSVLTVMTKYTTRAETIMAVFTVMTDTVIAMTLVFLLRRRRNKAGFITTRSVLNRLMQYVVGTSLITVFVASLALACNLRWTSSFSYAVLDLPIPKCK